jgi:hypothetical protein
MHRHESIFIFSIWDLHSRRKIDMRQLLTLRVVLGGIVGYVGRAVYVDAPESTANLSFGKARHVSMTVETALGEGISK